MAEWSGVLEGTDDVLDEDFRQECPRHIDNIDDIVQGRQMMLTGICF